MITGTLMERSQHQTHGLVRRDSPYEANVFRKDFHGSDLELLENFITEGHDKQMNYQKKER